MRDKQMKAIVCLDDNNGMLFNERRQSRDSVVINDIVDMAEDQKLFCNAYTGKLFDADKICIVNDGILVDPCEEGYYFYENILPASIDNFSEVVIYKWNRKYPGDVFFSFNLEGNGFKKSKTIEFVGSSHEKITKETWRK